MRSTPGESAGFLSCPLGNSTTLPLIEFKLRPSLPPSLVDSTSALQPGLRRTMTCTNPFPLPLEASSFRALSSLGCCPPESAYSGAAPIRVPTSIAASPPRNIEHHRATEMPFEKSANRQIERTNGRARVGPPQVYVTSRAPKWQPVN